MERLLERMPATLELVGTSTVLGVIVALIVGVVASVRRGFDRVTTVAVVAGISLPVFWFGLVLQLVFANALGWLPSSGRSSFGVSDLAIGCCTSFCRRSCWRARRRLDGRATCAARWDKRSAMPFTVAARARGASEVTHRASPRIAQRAASICHCRAPRRLDHGIGRSRDGERVRVAGHRRTVHRVVRETRLHCADGVPDVRRRPPSRS